MDANIKVSGDSLSNLRNDIQNAQSQIPNLKQQVVDLKAQESSLRDINDRLAKDKSILEANIAGLEETRKNKLAVLESMTRDSAELESLANQFRGIAQNLEESKKAADVLLLDVADHARKLKVSVGEINAQSSDFSKELAGIKKQMGYLETSVKNMAATDNAARKTTDGIAEIEKKLKISLDDLEMASDQAVNQSEIIGKTTNATLKDFEQRFTSIAAQMESTQRTANESIETTQAQSQALKTTAVSFAIQVESMREQVSAVTKEAATFKQAVSGIEASHRTVKETVNGIHQTEQQLEKSHNIIATGMKKLQKSTEKTVKALEHQIQATTKAVKGIDTEKKALAKQVDILTQHSESISSAIRHVQVAGESASGTADDLKAVVKSINNSTLVLGKSANSTEKQAMTLKKTAQNQLGQVKETSDLIAESAEKLKQAIANFEMQSTGLENDGKTLTDQMKTLQTHIAKTTDDLSGMSAQSGNVSKIADTLLEMKTKLERTMSNLQAATDRSGVILGQQAEELMQAMNALRQKISNKSNLLEAEKLDNENKPVTNKKKPQKSKAN